MEDLLAKGEDHEDVRDERLPYWAELWPSAIGLTKYLLASDRIRPGVRVLEMGCGMGLPGIAAAKRGGEVTLTDYLDDALEMARLNWNLNHDSQPDLCLLDWRHPDPAMASDVVLASDVAYEERNFQPLIDALLALVKPGGCAMLSEPSRAIAQPFREKLESLGLSVSKTEIPVKFLHLSNRVVVYEVAGYR
jgi:predicted nicotinamide N-methyase